MNFEYRVLSGASAQSLEEQVIDLCANEGFIPQGGVAVTVYSIAYKPGINTGDGVMPTSEYIYSQAVVKVSAKK